MQFLVRFLSKYWPGLQSFEDLIWGFCFQELPRGSNSILAVGWQETSGPHHVNLSYGSLSVCVTWHLTSPRCEWSTKLRWKCHFPFCKLRYNSHAKKFTLEKYTVQALAGVAQQIERQTVNQRVAGSIPSQGTCLGCRPDLQ